MTPDDNAQAPVPPGDDTPETPARAVTDADGLPVVAEGAEAEERMAGMTRRAVIQAGLAVSGVLGGMWAFNRHSAEDRIEGAETGIKAAYREGLEFNERVARTVFFSETHRDREFPRSAAVTPRNNYHGETPVVAEADWRLTLEGVPDGPRALTMADIRALPAHAQTTELKCVEGWSAVVHWAGVRFADFAAKYPPPPGTKYVALRSEPEDQEETWYYVGLDLESCLHPQTLLAYAMNDAPLDAAHGAPLRLVMPHKYGIKNIKLITHLTYSPDQPRDYWADRGYDWYAGL
jgi:DMSO/TMAO reductase YedYZ molybdopterin-dependent catalytic subunit